MKVAFITVGCRVNQYESEAMAEGLKGHGFEIVPPEGADLWVINTCVVTHRAEADSRKTLRRAKRLGKRAVVVGCWAQLDPDLPLQLGASAVVGTDRKGRIGSVLQEVLRGEKVVEVGEPSGRFQHLPLRRPTFRTRSLLKIQEGCDARCSYCVVPLVRGRSRSLEPQKVFEALETLLSEGVLEVVLTGVNLGSWGRDLRPPRDLAWLLSEIEDRPSPPRVRLSSVEPQEVTPELIEAMAASRKICHHLHLPLQSGSERVLQAMLRPYTPEGYRGLLERIKEAMPDAALGADLVVGFPTEDEEAFRETVEYLGGLPLSYLHVFPFSPRPGTPASGLPDKVPPRVKAERARPLRELGLKKRKAFLQGFLGRRLEVLVEDKRVEGLTTGLSRNYIRCLIEGEAPVGSEVPVRVLAVRDERALCRLED